VLGWDELEVCRAARGRSHQPRESVILIVRATTACSLTGDIWGLPGLPGAALTFDGQRSISSPPPTAADLLFPRPPLSLAGQTGTAGARTWRDDRSSTDAQASWWGGPGIGTVPHGLNRPPTHGDTVKARPGSRSAFHSEMNTRCWSDFENTRCARRSRWPRRWPEAVVRAPGHSRPGRPIAA